MSISTDARKFKLLIDAERIPKGGIVGPNGPRLRMLFKYEIEEIALALKKRGEALTWNTPQELYISNICIDTDNPVPVLLGEPKQTTQYPYACEIKVLWENGMRETLQRPLLAYDDATLEALLDSLPEKMNDDYVFYGIEDAEIEVFEGPFEAVIARLGEGDIRSDDFMDACDLIREDAKFAQFVKTAHVQRQASVSTEQPAWSKA